MSKTKLFYGVLFLQWCTLSISQNILWENSYGGKHAEFLYDAIPILSIDIYLHES